MTTIATPQLAHWQKAAALALVEGDTAAAWAVVPPEEATVSSILATIATGGDQQSALRDTTTAVMDALAYLEGTHRLALHYGIAAEHEITDAMWQDALDGTSAGPSPQFAMIARLLDGASICAAYDAADILHATRAAH